MRNEELNIAELVRHYRLFFRFVGGQILAGIIITFGIFLLIIPGILLSLRYMFVPYLIVDRHAGPITAIKQSWRLTAGYTWRLFLLWLAFVGISIIPATLAGILLASQSVFGVSESAALAVSLAGGAVLIVVAVLLAPVVLLTTAHVYNFLLGREEASAADLSTEKPSSADESQPADQHARASAEDSPSPDQS